MLEDFGGAIQDLLIERNGTHGSFSENGRVSQGIESVIHSGRNWQRLSPIKREALDMISAKLSRIVSGDPNYGDNWQDICGYATLALEECDEPIAQSKSRSSAA